MPFTKLDSEFASSSLFAHGLEVVGFFAYLLSCADAEGKIAAAVPDMAARCRVPETRVLELLAILEKPDPWSRTPDNEGRRIRIDREPRWSVVLLNYEAVRQGDSSAERVRRWRERQQRGLEFGPKPPQGTPCPCCSEPLKSDLSPWFVVLDHNHETGKPRAYICQSCNKLVGQVENGKKVPPQALEYVARYLKRYGHVTSASASISTSAAVEGGVGGSPFAGQRAEDAVRAEIRRLQNELGARIIRLAEHANSRDMVPAWSRRVTSWTRQDGSKAKGEPDYRNVGSIDRLEKSIADADWWLERLEKGPLSEDPIGTR